MYQQYYRRLKDKHRLLKAIARQQEIEATDLSKTLYEHSLDRVLAGYSKIKTQPSQALLYDPFNQKAPKITGSAEKLISKKSACSLENSRKLEI